VREVSRVSPSLLPFLIELSLTFFHSQGPGKSPGYHLGCENDGDTSVPHALRSLDSEIKIDWKILHDLVNTDGYFAHDDVNIPYPTAYEYRTTCKYCGKSSPSFDVLYSV
jgi:hypothetical protein